MVTERNALYDKVFQEKLVANIVRHPRLLNLLESGKISQEDFDFPVVRAVIQAASGVIRIQGHAREGIPQHVLMDQLMMMKRAGGILESEIPALAQLVHGVYTMDIAPDYYYPMVEGFLGHQRIQQALAKASVHKLDELPGQLAAQLDRSRIDQRSTVMPLVNFKRSKKVTTVPTGLMGIDVPMNGGLGKKEYAILCAYTGVGKTSLGINFGWGAAKQGFKVCFATLELDEDKIRERLYALVGRYSYDKIRYGDPSGMMTEDEIWTEVEERVARNASAYTPNGRSVMENFHIWDFSTESCSIQTLEDWTKREQDRDPEHPPDLLIVDWLLCLDERPGFDPRKMGDKEMRHKLQRYSDELSKKLARAQNMAVWATHQADAKAEGKDKITMAHAAEGKSVGWKCSVFLGVGASEQGRKDNIFTVNAAKMRDGRLFTCRISAQLHEQRFEDYNEADVPVDDLAPAQDDLAFSRQRQTGMVLPPVNPPATLA